MEKPTTNTTYDQIRHARIEENKRKLASMGVQKALSELKSLAPEKPPVRKCQKIDYSSTPLRRSSRVGGSCCYSEKALKARSVTASTPGRIQRVVKVCTEPPKVEDRNSPRGLAIDRGITRFSHPGSIRPCSSTPTIEGQGSRERCCYFEKVILQARSVTPSTPTVEGQGSRESCCYSEEKVLQALSVTPTPTVEEKVRISTSMGRGNGYTYGFSCHFCRQIKLCGEKDCKLCGDVDRDQPCIGKTDCSICHSDTGIFCRGCLKARYGEELEEVRADKQWACPHCIEEKGTKPYWICNSSQCLKKRKSVPTGLSILTAREMGYKSVAHLLMDKLKQDEQMMTPKSELNVKHENILDKLKQAPNISRMGKSYEEIRQARIEENKIKLATLGVQKTLAQLKSLCPEKRKARKIDYSSNPLRRSTRVKGTSISPTTPTIQEKGLTFIGRKNSPSYTHGFYCHFCRKHTLCGEEDCKKCGNLDRDQPCIGKTECSICHSSTGILCRDCLRVRYGEDLEEVRADKKWACPHCIEEKGIRPYWICNSFVCLKKRNMVQDHYVRLYKRMGYKSVAHLLMDKLKQDERMMMPKSELNVKLENI